MQSLILGAVLFIAAVVLWALGVIGDLLAAQRVMTQKTFERVRRIELELGVAPSHYEPGPADARAPRSGRGAIRPSPEGHRAERAGGGAAVSGVTVSEDGIVTGNTYDKYGSREPGRAPPDERLRAQPGRAVRPGRAQLAARRRLRRGRARAALGAAPGRGRAWWASTSRRSRSRPAGPSTQAPNLEYRVMEAENLPFADGRVRPRHRDRGARARPRPGAHARRDGPLRRAPPARLGPARAAVADAQHGARRLLVGRSATRRATSTTGPGARSCSCSSRHGEVVEVRSPFPWTMLLVRL